jgi:hypothetical protein
MNDQDLTITRCGELLHRVLVDIRQLSWSDEPADLKWIEELADLSHNLPRYMSGQDDHAIDGLRNCFIRHVMKRWPMSTPEKNIYIRLFDMSNAEFEEEYGKYKLCKPELAIH